MDWPIILVILAVGYVLGRIGLLLIVPRQHNQTLKHFGGLNGLDGSKLRAGNTRLRPSRWG